MAAIFLSSVRKCNAPGQDKENDDVKNLHNVGTRHGTGCWIPLQHTARSHTARAQLATRAIWMTAAWEVVACGEAEQIEKLIDWLKAGGPRSARVEKVLTEPHQPGREYVNFGIRY